MKFHTVHILYPNPPAHLNPSFDMKGYRARCITKGEVFANRYTLINYELPLLEACEKFLVFVNESQDRAEIYRFHTYPHGPIRVVHYLHIYGKEINYVERRFGKLVAYVDTTQQAAIKAANHVRGIP